MNNLSTVQARDKLTPQHEPYWQKLSSGCYLGFRKLTPTSTGSWLARYRDDQGKQIKKSLSDFSAIPASMRYDAAKRAADAWFVHLGKGGSVEVVTVRLASPSAWSSSFGSATPFMAASTATQWCSYRILRRARKDAAGLGPPQ